MGIRFNLQIANWLSYILEPGAPVPLFQNADQEFEAIRNVLSQLRENFVSSPAREFELHQLADTERLLALSGGSVSRVLTRLRGFFWPRSWTALLIPSIQKGVNEDYVCSRELLTKLVRGIAEGGPPGMVCVLLFGLAWRALFVAERAIALASGDSVAAETYAEHRRIGFSLNIMGAGAASRNLASPRQFRICRPTALSAIEI